MTRPAAKPGRTGGDGLANKNAAVLRNEKAYWEKRTEFEWLDEPSVQKVLAGIPAVNGDVLELCCGSGMFTRRIRYPYRSYTALDISGSMLRTLKRAMPKVITVQGNAEEPDLPPARYDLVLIFAGLHHLSDLPKAISNIRRLLRPGGTVWAFEPNNDCWYRKAMLPLRGLLNIYTKDERFLSPLYLRSLLRQNDFKDVAIKYLTPGYNRQNRSALNRGLMCLIAMASGLGRGRFAQSFFILSGTKQ